MDGTGPETRTDRLVLRRPDPRRDVADAFPIFADASSWAHAPELRHARPEQTRAWLRRAGERWDTDGLSYWAARRADSDVLAGFGGAQRQSTGAWNLAYRLAPSERGQGLATELAGAGLAAAQAHDPTVPVIAWIRPHNVPSRRVAERLGLVQRGLRRDPSDGIARLAYADRPLEDRYGAPVTEGGAA